MIDINELRRKVNSTDIVDHIDLHANIKPFLSELLDRLEAAEEDRSNFIVEMGKLCAQCDALCLRIEAAEKERDEFKRACFGHISDNSLLRAKIAEMEQQKPVGTLHDDGCFVWRKTAPHESNYAGWKMALYALPGAQGE